MQSLTYRQQQFLDQLRASFAENGQSVHYSEIARLLGVGNVTAYEMLRLLEARGLVTAEYQRTTEAGPGRASVAFRPLDVESQPHDDWGLLEWDAVRSRITEQLHALRPRGYDALLEKLSARLEQVHSPSEYLASMVTTILLSVNSLKEAAGTRGLKKIISGLDLRDESGLNALAGLGIGLTLVDRLNQRLAGLLLDHSARFQSMLAQLNAENRRRLSEFTREVSEIVAS